MFEEILTYLKPLKKYWQINLSLTVIILLIAIIPALLQTPEYRSKSTVLIIPQQELALEPIKASATAEVLINLVSKIIYSDTFLQKVESSYPDISKVLPQNQKGKKQAWLKMVKFNLTDQTGFGEVITYHPDKKSAQALNTIILDTFQNSLADYVYSEKQFQVQIINYPDTSEQPVRPNLIINLIIAIVAGFVFIVSLNHFFVKIKF